MQGLSRVTLRRLAGRVICGQSGDDHHGEAALQKLIQPQGRVNTPVDQGRIFRQGRKTAVVETDLPQDAIDSQPQDHAKNQAHRPIMAPSKRKRNEICRGFIPRAANKPDFTRALVDGHQQQVENADAGNDQDDDAEDVHHAALGIDSSLHFGKLVSQEVIS